MDRGSRPVRTAWVVGLALLLLLVEAVPASAAFPGANGRLVVQPANGSGLLLVGVGGAHPRQICMVKRLCDRAIDPVWSPDGSEIAFASPRRSGTPGSNQSVIYPDGSCVACPVPSAGLRDFGAAWDRSGGLGFMPDGRLVMSVDVTRGSKTVRRMGAMNTDGIGLHFFKVLSSWRQLAWSSTGRLAAVRSVRRRSEVFVVNPRTGSARRLTRGGASSPSWSPDGRRLAVVRRGWIELVGSSGGRLRRLTRGGAPVWSPNGEQLAFVGAHERLFVIAARGGKPRPVGQVRARRADWQPATGTPSSPCQAPADSRVAAASPDATISIDPAQAFASPFSVLGCLTSDGRERLLESGHQIYYTGFWVGAVALAGDYAALVNESSDGHYGGTDDTVAVFDLRTATRVAGGESVGCAEWSSGSTGPCDSGIDQLVLGTDGDNAAHTFVFNNPLGPSCQSVEQIVANDSTGTHVLDSITTTTPYSYTDPRGCDSPAPSQLSQLLLSGHTLTWSHAGIPESAQLN